MNFIKFYVFGALVIGLLQVANGILLLMNQGHLGLLSTYVSTIEFLWFPISLSTLVVFHRQKINILSPSFFLIYNLLSWGIATAMPHEKINGLIIMPVGFMVAGIIAGLIYSFVSYPLIKNT